MSERLSSSLSDEEFLDCLRQRLAELRIPHTGSVELTRRCTQRCVHCYVGDQASVAASRAEELPTAEWLRIVDEINNAGCLDLLLTGGEPLLRPDFETIYSRAKRKGMLVTVFTNGTRVTPRIAAVFADLPPVLVEISIYGATAETHDGISQVPGSFDQCMAGVEALLRANVKVGLKTILMAPNRHEYREMEAMAARLGARWRMDGALFPCLPNADSHGVPNRCGIVEIDAGDARAPMGLRVAPEEVVALEALDGRRRDVWEQACRRGRGRRVSDKLYTCGAGLTGFHIDPYGSLQPCLMTPAYGRSLRGRPFREVWEEMGAIREVKAPAGYECNACEKQAVCAGCPAFFDLENGNAAAKSEYACGLTQLRFECIQHRSETPEVPQP